MNIVLDKMPSWIWVAIAVFIIVALAFFYKDHMLLLLRSVVGQVGR